MSLQDELREAADNYVTHSWSLMRVAADELDRLTAELAAAKKDAEWKPIETAPKEGAWALVYADGAINCAYVEAGKLPEDYTRPENPNVFPASVTHWMPLPAPPIDAAIAAQPTEPK